MTRRTPKQRRQATARMLEKKLPANPKVKANEVTLSRKEFNRIKRDLER